MKTLNSVITYCLAVAIATLTTWGAFGVNPFEIKHAPVHANRIGAFK
jgi:hypothetical protein